MPIHRRYDRQRKKWIVENSDNHHIFGEHPNEEEAIKQEQAMAANGVDMTGKEEPKKPATHA